MTSAHADGRRRIVDRQPVGLRLRARLARRAAARRARRRRCRAGSARARAPAIRSRGRRPSAPGSARGRRRRRNKSSASSNSLSLGILDAGLGWVRVSSVRPCQRARRLHRIRHAASASGIAAAGRRAGRSGCRRRATSRRGRCAPSRARRRGAARRAGRRSWLPMPAISITSDSGATSTTRAPKTSASCMIGGAALAVGADLDQREIADDRRAVGDVLDADHVNQLVEVRLDPLRAARVGLDDDRHARDARASRCGRRPASGC